MTVALNKKAFNYAKKMIAEGKVVIDDKDAWSEHKPSTLQENEYLLKMDFLNINIGIWE